MEYTMSETLVIAKQSAQDIEDFLKSCAGTLAIINVEENKKYQKEDVDLILVDDSNTVIRTTKIEIKGDRWHHTGNYFFEVISNKQKGTEGCFLYTQSDYIFYYFVKQKELHILPTAKTREWFLQNKNRFRARECTSLVGEDSYNTVGYLVPRSIVLEEVEGTKVINLNETEEIL